jgi:hypothetical protein
MFPGPAIVLPGPSGLVTSITPIIDSTILVSLHHIELEGADLPQQIPCILVNFSERKNQHSIAVGNGVQLLTIQNSEIVRYRNEV